MNQREAREPRSGARRSGAPSTGPAADPLRAPPPVRLGNRAFGEWLQGRLEGGPPPRPSPVAAAARDGLPAALGSGRPLDVRTRASFEPLLGQDLGAVRVHDDAAAAALAGSLGARAATLGRHLVFAGGQFAPDAPAGRHLLAHELAHAVQLAHLAPSLAAPLTRRGSALECDAEASAERTARGLPAAPRLRAQAPVIARVPDGLKNQSERDAEAYNHKRVAEALSSLSWAEIKKRMYAAMIGGLRSAQKAAFDALRASVAAMDDGPGKSALEELVTVFDEFVGVLITLVLAVAGIVVGFGEGVVDMVKGLLQLVVGILKWIGLVLYGFIDDMEAFKQYNEEIVAAARNLVPGLKKIVKDWIERFEKSSIDEGTLMIGELTGQILALIASCGFAASKAGQVPKLALAADIPIMTARGELVLSKVAVVVDVSSPVAASGLVGTQAMRVTGGPGDGPPSGGGSSGGSGDNPDFKDLSDKEIDKALEPLQDKGPKSGGKGGGRKAPPGVPALPVEEVVAEGVKRLKAQGVSGLGPREYGTKLHAAVRDIVLERTGQPANGWTVAAEEQLGKVVKLRPEFADLTVEKYMEVWGMTKRYPALPEKFRGTVIKNLKPDVFVRAPNGRALVWDLTSKLDSVHLAKTMFYAELIGRELGGFFRIAESYWRKIF
ncbi:hypothetical protein GCM10028796_21020 [Ramlibacter monticola]|uniref:DUF4157 domain-containing protein n=1 Tax=Ramlibacter monticola TaxID=1926872 RepID=A0A937CTB5_9BURK|nr:DUF4157 domain-containing protein [Ramlibacter monticola]MBL0392355.1 DUF4157 domain-containing protein [Ramlibacter monticola]